MEFTIPELKLLHAAGVPIQCKHHRDGWSLLKDPRWSWSASQYRPDPAALVFRSPEGVLTLGHSREQLLAAQAAGLLLEQFVEGTGGTGWVCGNTGKWNVSDRSLPYRLRPGQPAWPAPEAKPEAAPAAPWAREKRALAAGLRVQCRSITPAGLWGTWRKSQEHSLCGFAEPLWNGVDWEYRVHPDDEPALQAIERGERPEDFQGQNAVRGLKATAAAAWDEHKDKTHSYAMWLAARPARLAARKPIAVSTSRFNAFPDMAGWTSHFGGGNGYSLHNLPREFIGAWPIHNPDARMATVPVGHEKGMP